MDMNRNVIIGLVVVMVAGAGYYQFSYKPAQEAAAMAAATAAEAAKAAETAAAAAATEAEAAAAAAAKVAEDEAAAAATTSTTDAATTAATDAATTVTDAATDAMAVLDPANFDAVKVTAMIDASTLGDDVKTTLKAAVTAAASNAALVEPTIAQIKTALGL